MYNILSECCDKKLTVDKSVQLARTSSNAIH